MNSNTIRGVRAGFASPTLGANAYKRLGIRTSDISRNLFTQATGQNQAATMSVGGKIVRSEFFGFWGQLSISESLDAKQFFDCLLEQIRELDIRQQAAGSTGAQMSVNGIPQASIYNTIAFMLCSTSIRLETEKLTLAYNTYADPSRDTLRTADSTGLKQLMKLIAVRTQSDQSDENILSPFVLGATHLIPKDVRYLDWIKQPTIDENDIQSNEHGFLYWHLVNLVQERTTELVQPLLKAIFDKAHSLPQQAKMSMPTAEQSFLAVLHLVKHFLSVHSVPNPDFLDRGVRIFRQFTLWHQPYGKLADQIVYCLKQEMLNPGFNRRRAVYHESLVVDYGTATNGTTLYRHNKPIFYLYDTLDPAALPMLNIIDPISLQAQHLVRPQVTMIDQSAGQSPPAAILTQILVHAFDTISPSLAIKQDELTAIQNLSQEKIISFTNRLTNLENKYQILGEQNGWSVELRDQDYNQLKADLMKIARQSGGPAMFQVPFTNEGLQAPPQLPPVEHVRIPVELKSKTNDHDGSNQTGYPAVAMYDRMQQILQAYAQDPSLKFDGSAESSKLRELRFVLIGNDRFLQHVITAYHLLQSNTPNAFHGLDVKFYLAPCTKNFLANYIAKNDLWYYRHVFTPLRSPFPYLVPFLRDDETEIRTNNDSGLVGCATAYYRDVISHYCREAHHTFRTSIFKVQGRTDPNSIEPSDVIPFIQRIELGLLPAVEEFKTKQGAAGSQLKLEDVLKDKSFVYSPVEFAVKYFKVDLSNQPKPEVVDDPLPYQSISLSHVPRKGDQGNVPDPTSKGLELFVNPGSKIDKSRLKKNSLVLDPRQHLAEITCSSVTPFKILADGVLHGPFRSVRISIAQNKSDGKIAHFPIQTFFPIQTSP
jgi:hypothetical protein